GEYLRPPRVRVPAGELAMTLPDGVDWFAKPRVHLGYLGGVGVVFAQAVAARRLRVQVLWSPGLRFRFVKAGVPSAAAQVTLPGDPLQFQHLQTFEVRVPEQVVSFDVVWIDAAVDVDTVGGVGGVLPVP